MRFAAICLLLAGCAVEAAPPDPTPEPIVNQTVERPAEKLTIPAQIVDKPCQCPAEPCICGDDCRCEACLDHGRRERLLLFTEVQQGICAPCDAVKYENPAVPNSGTLPKLERAGWAVGGRDDQIQVVAPGSPLYELFCVETVPTWILIRDGKEVRRRDGFLGPFDVGELFKGFREEPARALRVEVPHSYPFQRPPFFNQPLYYYSGCGPTG